MNLRVIRRYSDIEPNSVSCVFFLPLQCDMALPADTSNRQRYTAGQCVLDVTSQPLALSKWYPQPVVQNLQFQLWLQTNAAAEPVLIAEGDRTALHDITQYVSQQVTRSLVTAQLSAPASEAAPFKPLSMPPVLNISAVNAGRSLSYLQLCDLAAVLNQCEQGMKALPATLPVTLPLTAAPALIPLAQAKQPQTKLAQNQDNVISFSSAQRFERDRSALRSHSKGRSRTKLWASSAAAASVLAAVGLSGVLRPESTSEQQITAANPNQLESNFEGNTVPEGISPESAAPNAISRNAPPETETKIAAPAAPSPERNSATDLPVAQQPTRIESPLPGESLPISPTQKPSPSASPESPQIAVAPSVPPAPTTAEPSPEIDALPRLPSTSSDRAEPESAAPSPAVKIPDETIITELPTVSSAESGNQSSNRSPNASVSSDNLFNSGTRRARASTEESAPADLDLAELDPAGRNPAERNPAERNPWETEASAPSTAIQTDAVVQAEVQSYFQRQWQSIRASISEPLAYTARISATGDIVGFVGLDEVSQSYRNSLLPAAESPQFSSSEQGLQLRLEISTDGRVSVTEN